jgi:hypothetical protein
VHGLLFYDKLGEGLQNFLPGQHSVAILAEIA